MSLVKKRLALGLICSVLLISFLLSPLINITQAQGLWDDQAGKAGIETAYNVGTNASTDLRTYTARVIKVFLSFLGLIFLIVIVWGAYEWMTAGGNEDNVKIAKARIKNGIIGFIIIILSYVIVDFVIRIVYDNVLKA